MICFGWFILGSIESVLALHAARAPGSAQTLASSASAFSDSAFFRLIMIETVLATCALAYLRVRGYKLTQLVPLPSGKGCLVGMLLYAISIAISVPLIGLFGADQPSTAQPIQDMVSKATISFLPLVCMSIVNGLYEEVFLIGFLQRGLQELGASFAIGAALLVRLLYHLYQGPVGITYVLGFGLVVGMYFAWKKTLWPIVYAHIFADIAGFSIW